MGCASGCGCGCQGAEAPTLEPVRAVARRPGLEVVNRGVDRQDPRLRPTGERPAPGFVPLESVTGWLAEHDPGFRAVLGKRGGRVEPEARRSRSRSDGTTPDDVERVQSDVHGLLEGCAPGFLPSTIAVADLATWRRRLCRISFGTNAVLGIELAADVPATFEPWKTETTADDALSVLLPDWYRRYVAVKESARLALPPFSAASTWPKNKGLFWTGHGGFGEAAVRMAARTVIAYGDHVGADREAAIACFGDMGRRYGWPKLLRDMLASYQIKLRVDIGGCVNSPDMILSLNKNSELGFLRPHEGPPREAFLMSTDARRKQLHICGLWLFDAGIADYYFYWAHRLFAYSRVPGVGTPWHAFVACVSAKLALTQIVEIGGKLAHELGHFTGTQHCEDGSRCCQFLVDQLFCALTRAQLGLPVALLSGNTTAPDVAPYPDSRLRYDLTAGYDSSATSPCDLAFTEAPFLFNARHCASLAPRWVYANWSINPICGRSTGSRSIAADPSAKGVSCRIWHV